MELLNNGLDSLKKCVAQLTQISMNAYEDNEYEYLIKDIIISLHHSCETLFKFLVMQKNEYLIYNDIGAFFKQAVENRVKSSSSEANFNTIQFMDAVNAVIILYNNKIDKSVYNRIKHLNNTRNALTHFTFTFEQQAIDNIIFLLPEMLSIYDSHIPGFDKFARKNKIYEDVRKLTNITVDELKMFESVLDKWTVAQTHMVFVDAEQKGNLYQMRQKNYAYIKCPCCDEQLFHPTGTVIIRPDNIFGSRH